MSNPYDDYDGYLKANLKWFLSLTLVLAAIAAAAFFASQPAPPAQRQAPLPANAEPGR